MEENNYFIEKSLKGLDIEYKIVFKSNTSTEAKEYALKWLDFNFRLLR